jgi:hypothetical protein
MMRNVLSGFVARQEVRQKNTAFHQETRLQRGDFLFESARSRTSDGASGAGQPP